MTADDNRHPAKRCNPISKTLTLCPLADTATLSAEEIKRMDGIVTDRHAMVVYESHRCADSHFGRLSCDFAAATALFYSPGDTIHADGYGGNAFCGGTILTLHPDLLAGGSISMSDYRFFGYNENEALHLSACELRCLLRYIDDMTRELRLTLDEYSHSILERLAGLTLDMCRRFYTRQFIMRSEHNMRAIKTIARMVDCYYHDGGCSCRHTEPPTTAYLSRRMGCSAAYLEDTVRHETGLSVTEQVDLIRVDIAQSMLTDTGLGVDSIAARMGFRSGNCLRKIIEKSTGAGPDILRTIC